MEVERRRDAVIRYLRRHVQSFDGCRILRLEQARASSAVGDEGRAQIPDLSPFAAQPSRGLDRALLRCREILHRDSLERALGYEYLHESSSRSCQTIAVMASASVRRRG